MGTLNGIKVIEMGGIGPGPHCGMILADHGADVIRIERPVAQSSEERAKAIYELMNRNKRSVSVDLKQPHDIEFTKGLINEADVLIEGFRPGVMERLGLGPEIFASSNSRLIYARMTGWGQTGPLAGAAGHDLNYIAVSGALDAIGRAGEAPDIPLNLIGDFGGGSLYLAVGILAGLLEAKSSGVGQVIDCAIIDGVSNLLALQCGMMQSGEAALGRGANLLDGGSHFYNIYGTSDEKFVTIAAVEPKFYRELLARLGVDDEDVSAQYDRTEWPRLRRRFADIFRQKSRSEWCELLEGTDVCFAPVLNLWEAVRYPQNALRENMLEAFGVINPAPAPRFSRTPGELSRPPCLPGEHTAELQR